MRYTDDATKPLHVMKGDDLTIKLQPHAAQAVLRVLSAHINQPDQTDDLHIIVQTHDELSRFMSWRGINTSR